MMKIQYLVITLIAFSTQLSAQLQIGVKGSYGIGTTGSSTQEFVSLNPATIAQIAYTSTESRKGLGLSLYADNDKLFLMTDGLFTQTERSFELLSLNASRTPLDPALIYESSVATMRLAVTAGVKLGNWRLGAGPEFSFLLDSTQDLTELSQISYAPSKLSGGFSFLLGYTLWDHVHIDLRHSYQFQDVMNGFRFDGVPTEMGTNPKTLELSLGLYF